MIQLSTANKQDDARLDIRAKKRFWSRQQDVFFDVRVIHPKASSYQTTIIPALYRQEGVKKREYGDRIREVEHAVFTPLFQQWAEWEMSQLFDTNA